MRIIKILLFFFLLLVAGLGIARFIFLDQLTTMVLDRAGIRDAGIHFSVLNLGKTKIETLQATFALASGEMLPITLKEVVLDYSPQQLLATGKCSQVSIGVMEIKRTALQHAPTSSFSLPEQISLLRDELRARLPLQELQIDRLRLIGDFPKQIKEKDIGLHALINNTEVTADLHLQLTDDTIITGKLKSVDARQGTAVLAAMKGKEEILKSTVTLTPDTLSTTVDLQMQPVLNLLQQTTDIWQPVQIAGRLTAHATLPLQQTNNIQAELTLIDNAGHQLLVKADGNPKTRKLTVLFNGLEQKQQFMHAEFALSKQRVKGSYQFQAAALRSFLQPYLQQPLPEFSGTFNGIFDLPLPGSSTTSFQFTALATSPALRTFSSTAAQLQLVGNITGQTLELAPEAQLNAQEINVGTTRVDALSLGLAGIFSRREDQVALQFAPKQQFRLQGITAGKLVMDNLELTPQSPLHITVGQGSWSAAANTFRIQPMQAAYATNSGVAGPINCTLNRLEDTATGLVLDTAVTMPSLVIDSAGLKLGLKDISSSFQLQQGRIKGTMQLAPQTIPGRVKATFSHDLATKKGSFTLRTDRRFDVDQEGISLAQLFTPWNYPFDLDQGKISFKADGSWADNKKLRLNAFAAVTGGSGYFKQFVFNGLNIRQDLFVLPRLSSKTEGSFALQQLIGAVDVHDIRANINFIAAKQGPLPQVKINDFSASLFAGSISSPAILYDLNQPNTAFTVMLNKLDLETMIEMIKMNSLHVTGKLSGEIPVRILGKEVTVDDGTLYSEPPGGEIRYTPENTGQTGVTGYALKAVEDFRYDSLKTTAEYLPSGQLNLDISLQGISPELSTTRPVHLNIHAEQNLPSLLQSLRFSKGLTDELDKRVNQHYK